VTREELHRHRQRERERREAARRARVAGVDVETWVSWHAIGEKPTLWHVADGDVTLCGRPIMARIPTRRSAPAVPDRVRCKRCAQIAAAKQ
jgi:hypothetical protein